MALDVPHDRATIEFLTIANHVEAINGLLYMIGGGWTDQHRPIQGGALPSTHLGIAVSVHVPWNDTNRPHQLAIDIENEDATVQVAHIDAQLNVGRAPTLPPGSDQHAVLAIGADIVFPAQGGHRVVARLDGGEDVRTWAFRIHDMPLAAPAPAE